MLADYYVKHCAMRGVTQAQQHHRHCCSCKLQHEHRLFILDTDPGAVAPILQPISVPTLKCAENCSCCCSTSVRMTSCLRCHQGWLPPQWTARTMSRTWQASLKWSAPTPLQLPSHPMQLRCSQQCPQKLCSQLLVSLPRILWDRYEPWQHVAADGCNCIQTVCLILQVVACNSSRACIMKFEAMNSTRL